MLKLLDKKWQRIQQIGSSRKTKHVAENYTNFAIIIEKSLKSRKSNSKINTMIKNLSKPNQILSLGQFSKSYHGMKKVTKW